MGAAPTGGMPPGWYPDPRNPGQEQWWSGSSWTMAFQPAGTPPALAPIRQHARKIGGAQPGTRRKWPASKNSLVSGIAAMVTTVGPFGVIFGSILALAAIGYGVMGLVQSGRTGQGVTPSVVGIVLGGLALAIWLLAGLFLPDVVFPSY